MTLPTRDQLGSLLVLYREHARLLATGESASAFTRQAISGLIGELGGESSLLPWLVERALELDRREVLQSEADLDRRAAIEKRRDEWLSAGAEDGYAGEAIHMISHAVCSDGRHSVTAGIYGKGASDTEENVLDYDYYTALDKALRKAGA